jgi:hypothetical protein
VTRLLAVCCRCAKFRRGRLARRVGQIVSRGRQRWLIRVFLGRDHQTRKRRYHNRTIHGTAPPRPGIPDQNAARTRPGTRSRRLLVKRGWPTEEQPRPIWLGNSSSSPPEGLVNEELSPLQAHQPAEQHPQPTVSSDRCWRHQPQRSCIDCPFTGLDDRRHTRASGTDNRAARRIMRGCEPILRFRTFGLRPSQEKPLFPSCLCL